MTAQTIHLRIWKHRRAGIACSTEADQGTSSPNPDKVTCRTCKAVMAEVKRRHEQRVA